MAEGAGIRCSVLAMQNSSNGDDGRTLFKWVDDNASISKWVDDIKRKHRAVNPVISKMETWKRTRRPR